MTRRSRPAVVTIAALATLLLLSSCGDDKDDGKAVASTTAAPTTAAATTAVPAATDSSAAVGGAAKLAVAKSATLGDVVVDAQGFTLYRFDNDTNEPPKSNCAGGCLATWPPAITTGTPQVSGVDASLVGTLKLADGSEQITVGGWPLYRFAPDAAPGDTKGQGVGGIWWALTPKGDKAATP